jgi:hypothetical protein
MAAPTGYATKIRKRDNGDTLVVDVTNGGKVAGGAIVHFLRKRVTAAEVNAGLSLVSAPGLGYALRLVDVSLIAIGGAASGATTVDVLATLATASRKLLAAAIAGLTQSAVLRAGAANAAVLADGASYTANDENTALTIGKTGASLATATHVDVLLAYVIDEV